MSQPSDSADASNQGEYQDDMYAMASPNLVPVSEARRDTADFDSEKGTAIRAPLLPTVNEEESRASQPTGTLRKRKSPEGKRRIFTSLDYQLEESEVKRSREAVRRRKQNKWWNLTRQRATKRWIIIAVSGMVIALAGVGTIVGTELLLDYKFGIMQSYMDENRKFMAFITYYGFNLLFGSIAGLLVVMEPVAAGSGIPEIKSFLNGIDIPRVVNIRTIFSKVTGVTFAVAGGFPCGKEGPMIHTGAGMCAGISQGKSTTLGFDFNFEGFEDFRNDREKRDMVACGAAAGVCTAFGSPIGGVLFALEEGTSHWSSALTWRTFFCVLCSMTTLYVANEAMIGTDFFRQIKMLDLGTFDRYFWPLWELILFTILGGVGGSLGAFFNYVNMHITKKRKRMYDNNKHKRFFKFVEVLCLVTLITLVTFLLPLAWNRCEPDPAQLKNMTGEQLNLMSHLVRFNCKKGEYNELASLFLTSQEGALRGLFHLGPAEGQDDAVGDTNFSIGCLVIFFVFYASLAVCTYGVAVPTGLFVPALLTGASFGRIVGQLFHSDVGVKSPFSPAGTYAFIGAVSTLGGIARMTISLTVIMLETIQDLNYILPVMLTLIAARWIGNAFNEGLYDIQIHLNRLPLMEPSCPKLARQHDMCIRELMSDSVHSLKPVMNVGELYDIVSSTKHNMFPVTGDNATLQGTIARKRLAVIYKKKAFGTPRENFVVPNLFSSSESELQSPLILWEELEHWYPKYPEFDSPKNVPNEIERKMIVDLRPYMNTSPNTIHESASAARAYTTFRSMGMRHLLIVDHNYHCVGIVTRHDLLAENIASQLRKKIHRPALIPPRKRAASRRLRTTVSEQGRPLYLLRGFGEPTEERALNL
eukprot:m.247499 g.247499  ORF g.247499 m.247499 type:complete len:870 (-) comp16127_c0_seq1:85-2694(-)